MFRPFQVELIRKEVAQLNKRKLKAGDFFHNFMAPENQLLHTKRGGDWMIEEHGKPEARTLFGSLWFEHELCIMFADTNLGKSILAVQIADALTKCTSFEPFYNMVDESPVVLYIDFELSAKQFHARYYSHRFGSYLFSDNFYRSQFNPEADTPLNHTNYEEFVRIAISRALEETKATILIIDNITYMNRGTGQSNQAMALMKTLKALKIKYNLSVLVLAHTPKRNPNKPITVNDLQGSKMLINFADSAFAIGQSHTRPGTRYIKQVKQRSKKEEFGEANVCLISPEVHLNFLRYKFEGYAHEHDHLRRADPYTADLQKQQIYQLSKQGLSNRKIARQEGVAHTTVSRILQARKVNSGD